MVNRAKGCSTGNMVIMDVRGVADLVNEAVAAIEAANEDRRRSLVCHLPQHGGSAAFDAARLLCDSRDPRRRELGVDILGQTGPVRQLHQGHDRILARLDPDARIRRVARPSQ